MRAFYLAPLTGSGAFHDPRRGLYTPNPRKDSYVEVRGGSTTRYGYAARALCAVDADVEVLREIKNDPRCFMLATELSLDAQVSSARWLWSLREQIEQRFVPGDWLSLSLTLRQVLYGLTVFALLPQRFAGLTGEDLGGHLDARCRGHRLTESLLWAVDSFGIDRPAIGADVRFRDVLRHVARQFLGLPMYCGGLRLDGVVRNSQADIAALYGDNRNQVAADTFDSAISADWDNGYADFGTLAWNTGGGSGTVTPSAGFVTSGMRRLNATFTADHYATITANLGTTGTTLSATVRNHPDSTTDESCYAGGWNNYSSDTYAIEEVSAAFGFSTVASAAWAGAPVANGETLTSEAEGTTLRCGTAEGGADTQRVTGTDATLGGATYSVTGLLIYCDNTPPADNGRITAWAGGSIGAAAALSLGARARGIPVSTLMGF